MPKDLLLAGNSKTLQQRVSMTFAREDVKLTTVDDGNAAFQAAKSSKPDLILADVSMPGLGGYELCQKVRADAAIKDVPVLLLGGGAPIDPAKAMAVGANGHMPKPFDSGKLIEQVKQILANPRVAARPAAAAPAPAAGAAARPPAPPAASRPPAPAGAPRPPVATPGAAGSTMMMSRPPPAGAPRPAAPPAARPPSAAPPGATRPSMPPVARPPLTGAPV